MTLTTEINAKQKCLEMLENARKRSDLIRQRYEERIKLLSERIQHADDEKQAAVTKLSEFICGFIIQMIFWEIGFKRRVEVWTSLFPPQAEANIKLHTRVRTRPAQPYFH